MKYADDTILICSSRHKLMDLLCRLKQASEKKGFLLNTKKTKIVVNDRQNSGKEIIGNNLPRYVSSKLGVELRII